MDLTMDAEDAELVVETAAAPAATHVFPGLTLTSVTAVHSIRLFADDYSILER